MPMDEKLVEQLKRRVGPAAVRFVEYAHRELRERALFTALEAGFSVKEATYIAEVTVGSAVKGISSAITATRNARAFEGPH